MVKKGKLHPEKYVFSDEAITSEGIFFTFIDSPTITSSTHLNILKREFFQLARKRKIVSYFHFVQDGTNPHRTFEVFEELVNAYGTPIL